jgi:hypothetical protein
VPRHRQKHTVTIERDNSKMRHHLGRSRADKVVSRKEFMVDLTLHIRHAVTTTNLFTLFRQNALYMVTESLIYRGFAPNPSGGNHSPAGGV